MELEPDWICNRNGFQLCNNFSGLGLIRTIFQKNRIGVLKIEIRSILIKTDKNLLRHRNSEPSKLESFQKSKRVQILQLLVNLHC